MQKLTIAQFLLRRLLEAGVNHIFGVPGDYNLEFVQQLEENDTIAWIGNCNELNSSYAADGYARLNGLGALVVTDGVGALSAINGIAGAYSEHVPVICICGSLPLNSVRRGLMMHHTLAHACGNNFYRALSDVTVAQAQLRPENAAAEIDRLILNAWRHKLPVYLELPSDIAYLEIEGSQIPLQLTDPASDSERLQSCANAIVERLASAKSPAILLDLDADRFGLLRDIVELARKRQLPVAALKTCKGCIDETSPYFVGIYAGAGSTPAARQAVEESDCLLTIGFRRVDSTSGFFSDAIPSTAIHLNSFSASIGNHNYEAVVLKGLLKEVLRSVVAHANPATSASLPNGSAVANPSTVTRSGKLTQSAYWRAMQGFIRKGDVIIAEIGTSSAGAGALSLPPNCTFISQAIWGSVGYSLPCLLGTLIAAPERRHILFIGDGSFQFTAQELSTILRLDLKPFIFLINNGGYTIERTILGRRASYNDIANWRYTDLPRAFCPGTTASSFTVTTVEELNSVLDASHVGMVFVEAMMDTEDSPESLTMGGHAAADIDYGPRGPQHTPHAQIPLTKPRL